MKKLFTLLLITALALGLFGCSGSQNGGTHDNNVVSNPAADLAYDASGVRANYDKAEAYVDSLLDAKDMVTSTENEDDGMSLTKYWKYETETENAPLSDEITIDGNKIVIGVTTAKDLESFGLTTEKSSETVKPKNSASIMLGKDNKYCDIMLAPNDTDQEKPIDDLPVYEVMTEAKDFSLPFAYCGLTADSSLKDVLDALGTPNKAIALVSEDMGAYIEMNYTNETRDGDKIITDKFILRLVYDTDSNTALIDNVDLRRAVNPAADAS